MHSQHCSDWTWKNLFAVMSYHAVEPAKVVLHYIWYDKNDYKWSVGGTMGWQSVQTDCTKCTHNIAVSERETICLQWYDVLPRCGACQGCSTLYMIWQKWLYMKCRWDYGLAISSNRQHQMHSQHRSVWTWNNLFAVICCLTMLWSLPRLFYTIYDMTKMIINEV